MNRINSLESLGSEEFDICIIGAGASGAGAALDASLRGLKVALIDRNDFVSETSSKSTKLIHGGVRYLEQAFKNFDLGQLRQVKHGLEERHILLQIAPHLAQPLGLITPVFNWFEGLYYSIGLKIYGWFAKHDSLPGSRWLSKKEALQRMPGLNDDFHSAVLYFDGMFDDARFCLALVRSAAKQGAIVANYTEFLKFEKDDKGKLIAAVVADKLDKKEIRIKAKVFLNCTGPWADFTRLAADSTEEIRMKPSKGVHIVFSNDFIRSSDALLIPETSDGRVVFVKPLDSKIMAGTTDTAYNELDSEPMLLKSEVDYILETLQPYLRKMPSPADITAGFAGVRPLLAAKSINRKDTKSLLRDHEVEFDQNSGLVSLLGGKWTTYRLMAKDAVDFVATLLGVRTTCTTENFALDGAENSSFDAQDFLQTAKNLGLEKETRQHLLDKYGDNAPSVLQVAAEHTDNLILIHKDYPFILAELIYGIRYEMVQEPRDFFARRIKLELLDWQAVYQSLANTLPVFCTELKRPEAEINKSFADYKYILEDMASKAGIVINS